MSSSYLKLLIFLLAILTLAGVSSRLAQHDAIGRVTIYNLDVLLSQFGNQSIVLYPILTVASKPAYRFLRREVR